MKGVLIFFLAFFFFPLEKSLPLWFFLIFIPFIFLKNKYKYLLFFFIFGILCKNEISSPFPLKEYDDFKGRVLSFPYEGEYGVSYLVKWEKYGTAPIFIQDCIEEIPLGSVIKVRAEVLQAEESPKPFSKRYKFYLKVKTIKQIEISKKNFLEKLFYFPANLNRILYERVKEKIKIYKKLDFFIKTLIFGRYSYENEDFFDVFQMAGVVHILSISGLHTGIFLLYFLIFLRILKLPPPILYLLAILFLLFYASFCGHKAPVLRASLMGCLYIFFLLIHIPQTPEKTLYLSLPLNGFFMPNQILTPGFFLSYLSTYILIKGYYKFNSKFKSIFFSSFYVQLFIQPFLLYSFGILNWQSLILNPLILPFAFFFLLFLPLLIIFPEKIFLDIFEFFSNLIFGIVQGVKNNLWWGAYLPYLSIFLLLIYYLLSIYFIEKKGENLKIGKFLSYFFIILLFFHFSFINIPEKSFLFLNVGQGSSLLIKDGFTNILIDTGKRSFHTWLLPSLLKEKTYYLNLLVITHPSYDHDRWAEKIMDTIHLSGIAFPEIFKENFKYLIEKAEKEGINVYFLKRKNYFKTENLKFEVLHPEIKNYKNANEGSLVLQISSKNKNLLLTGDAPKKVEEEVLKYLEKNLDILVVGHHGSNTSTSKKLLKCKKPKIGIISVGRKNPYNHPSKEVIEDLKKNNILILRTDVRGTIKVNF